MEEPIQNAKSGGIHDLDLQDAALTAENMIGVLQCLLCRRPRHVC
jgi:hypothetical protein